MDQFKGQIISYRDIQNENKRAIHKHNKRQQLTSSTQMIQMHQENNVQVNWHCISISLLLLMVIIPLAVEIAKPFIVGSSSIGSSSSTIKASIITTHCNTILRSRLYPEDVIIPPSSSDHYTHCRHTTFRHHIHIQKTAYTK